MILHIQFKFFLILDKMLKKGIEIGSKTIAVKGLWVSYGWP